ncbi:hypothetical protein [Sphingomonas sp. ACRSK]|nr:hypothetical protein [Sphingomonas sp. ACRSK]
MDEDDSSDFRACEGCGGSFYHGDLIDGDYCEDCFEEMFGGEPA